MRRFLPSVMGVLWGWSEVTVGSLPCSLGGTCDILLSKEGYRPPGGRGAQLLGQIKGPPQLARRPELRELKYREGEKRSRFKGKQTGPRDAILEKSGKVKRRKD